MEITTLQIVLVFVVACIAGMESVLDEFQFHRPLIACTLIGAQESAVRLPLLAALSAACWKPTVIVRTMMVSTWPAAALDPRLFPVPAGNAYRYSSGYRRHLRGHQ